MDFKKLLTDNKFVFLDGAMGTMLQKSGLKTGEIPELLNITHPEVIENIYSMYIESGSDIVYANTFGANRFKLEGCGHSVSELIRAGISCAKRACEKSGREAYTALDIGPIGQLLEPTGSLSFEEAYDIFKEEILAAEEADIIVIETMTDLYEVKAALLAASLLSAL